MQEIVSFSIKVKKRYPEVVAAVKKFFESDEWRITEEDEKNKEKNKYNYQDKQRFAGWKEDVKYDLAKSMIYNDGEGWKMYQEDYYVVSKLVSFIIENVPDSDFFGKSEYYYGDVGTIYSGDFTYKKEKLEENDTSPNKHLYDEY